MINNHKLIFVDFCEYISISKYYIDTIILLKYYYRKCQLLLDMNNINLFGSKLLYNNIVLILKTL